MCTALLISYRGRYDHVVIDCDLEKDIEKLWISVTHGLHECGLCVGYVCVSVCCQICECGYGRRQFMCMSESVCVGGCVCVRTRAHGTE